MRQRTIKILKKDKVKVGGSVQLDGDNVSADSPAKPAGSAARQARIVESNNEYAIIEIICSCGQKAHVQCNYSNMTAS